MSDCRYDISVWLYGRQRRCQEDPVSIPSGRLEKTTRSSPHHVAQHRPTGSETTPPYAPRSSRFGSEPPSVEDDVNVWCYAIITIACQKRRRRRSLGTKNRLQKTCTTGFLHVVEQCSNLYQILVPEKSVSNCTTHLQEPVQVFWYRFLDIVSWALQYKKYYIIRYNMRAAAILTFDKLSISPGIYG